MNVQPFYKRYTTAIILGVLIGSVLLICVGYLFAPTVFYDQWIWKYYWGPVVADATGHSVSWHGVAASEGYTLISEITYGVILVCALFGLYQLLKKLQIKIDWYFCLALLPYILFGPVTRVLEDTNYFTKPAVYWFISPLIYFQTTLYVLLFLILGYVLEKKAYSPRKTTFVLIIVYALVDICYTLLWASGFSFGASSIHLAIFFVLSILAFLPVMYRSLKKQAVTTNTVIFSGGLLVVLPFLYLIGQWILGNQWGLSYGGVRFDVFLLIIGIVAFVTTFVYAVARIYQKHENIAVYKNPLNLSMLAGHLIDGLSSYISIYDPLQMGLPSYIEKHPASNGLMMLWPPLFPIVKFLLIIVVIYIFDVLYKKELGKYSRFVNLLKIGIFILGVSPGIRDLLLVTIGV